MVVVRIGDMKAKAGEGRRRRATKEGRRCIRARKAARCALYGGGARAQRGAARRRQRGRHIAAAYMAAAGEGKEGGGRAGGLPCQSSPVNALYRAAGVSRRSRPVVNPTVLYPASEARHPTHTRKR